MPLTKVRNDGAFNTIVATEGIFHQLSVELPGIMGEHITGSTSRTFAAFIPNATREELQTSGPISTAIYGTSLLTSNGVLIMTLADGEQIGQIKRITAIPGDTINGASITLATPAVISQNPISLIPPAENINGYVELMWTETGWRIIDLVNGIFGIE